MMAQDDPAAGIEKWEKNFWSLGGLLKGKSPRSSAAKADTSYHDEMVKEANESFRKAAEKRRGTNLKGSSSRETKRRSKRKSARRKPTQGK